MTQQQSPWLEGAYGWGFGEGGWNTGMDENLLKFSFMFDGNVDSIVGSLPSAVNGQAHFLTSDNRLYFAVGTTYFSSPVPKWFVFKVRSTGQCYQFNGTSATVIDSPSQIESRLTAVEVVASSLGTAAFEDIGAFATQSELDVVEAQAQAYTDTLRADIAAPVGAAQVGFGQTVVDKVLSVSVEKYGAVSGGVVDCSSAFTAAIAEVIAAGGGEVVALNGPYLISGTASPDTMLNGILLPSNGVTQNTNVVNLRGSGVTRLLCGTNNTMLIRVASSYTRVEGFILDNNGKTGCWGMGLVPENMSQTTTLVAQSFNDIENNVFEGSFVEGLVIQPGPTVLGADSGCFYNNFKRLKFNLPTRHVWSKKPVTYLVSNNRLTRSIFSGCTFTRGNSGLYLEVGTEIDIESCNFEMIDSGTSPSSSPTGMYLSADTANIRVLGGYAEACTVSMVNSSGYNQLFGWGQANALHSSLLESNSIEAGIIRLRPPVAAASSYLLLSRDVTAAPNYGQSSIFFGNTAFAEIVSDPDANGTKSLAFKLDNTTKWRMDTSSGFTHYGTIGNITLNASGAGVTFSRNSVNGIEAPGASASVQVVSGGAGGVVLSAGATAWAAVSDERSKVIGSNITDALSKLSELRTVFGRYIEDKEGVERAFLIAQDVQKVYPVAVKTVDGEDTLRLEYETLIPLMVAAINELAMQKV